MKNLNIGVIGAGSFGTVLANVFARRGHRVTLWGRDQRIVEAINRERINPVYLPEFLLHPFEATVEWEKACIKKEIILFAVPSQFLRSLLQQWKKTIAKDALLVNTAKGIEQQTLLTPSGIFSEVLGKSALNRFVALSGPTFAKELAFGHPSGAVVASHSALAAKKVQTELSADYFRLYTGEDVLGVELGGALKNVMAIGTGIAEGLGFGLNTRAGLITRCLYEMTRLGVAMGAKPLTFSGLSGLGDLILTCTGELSRNRQVGLELGRGKSLEEITQTMKSVVEGIATAKSAFELSEKHSVEMPNSRYVYRILYEGLPPKQALEEILNRELKPELKGL